MKIIADHAHLLKTLQKEIPRELPNAAEVA